MTTKESLLSQINEIIQELQSAFIFTNMCKSFQPIFQMMGTLINNSEIFLNPTDLEASISTLKDNLTDLTIKDKYTSFLKSDKSIPKFISEIEDQITKIFGIINKYFSQQFSIPSYAKYEDIQQIGRLLLEPEFVNDQEFDSRRQEIKELYDEIQIPYKKIVEKYDKEQKYRLDLKDYTKSTEIKTSEYYKEYEGTMNGTNEKVTITVFDNPEHFKNEFRILTQIDHPCFNKMKGFVITESSVEIVTTRRGEPLKNHINHMNHMVTIIMFKIASAMSYLHSKRIVHRDLNIDNIYIDNYESSDDSDITKVTPIITNLNKSIYLPHSSFLGLPNIKTQTTFSSPELISNYTYDEKADIFSFGGILYEIITGKSPFEDEIKEGQDMMQLILSGGRPEFPDDFPEEIQNLIEKCWVQRPNERYSFDQIVDQMSRGSIILPMDESNEEEIDEYYSTERIQNEEIIECSNSFDSCINDANRVFLFKYEFARAKPILFEYKYALLTSKYKSKETLDEDEQSKINALTAQLDQLHDVIESARSCSFSTKKRRKIEYFTVQLEEKMKNIYNIMKDLGFTLQEYKVKKKDLILDYYDFHPSYYEDFFETRDIDIHEVDDKKNLCLQLQKVFLPFTDHEVDRGDFCKKESIGSGAESIVYAGINIKTGQEVAIKTIHNQCFNDLNILKYLRREIGILCQCKHKYLMEFIGYSISESEDIIWLINELFPKDCDLYKLKYDMDKYEKTKILLEIAEGMEYLHSQGVLHRDLKTENVMILDNSPKIIDFGYSTSRIAAFSMTNRIGTEYYMAPEVCQKNPYGFPADVFSFGMLAWELYSGVYPFSDLDRKGAIKKIRNGVRPPFELPISNKLKELIEKCWNGDAEKRPSFTDIIDEMIENQVSYLLDNPEDEEDEDNYDKMKRQIEDLYKAKKDERS